MLQRGLHALQPNAFTPRTADSTHGLRCYCCNTNRQLLQDRRALRPQSRRSRTSWATATTVPRPKVCGRVSKRRYSNRSNGPFSQLSRCPSQSRRLF